ncbi:hypothetical protein DV096_00865 [Bradymonadaceae bacterium TMQ3]|uniref:Uncharacterized protein n=1 Tax=Lujinxingia sediminis TaxID=2480984 RepID=A0ABY0CY41_9DELT|nr:hypothetical protein [Lujinxingia sediminis]RDV39156.1 hypothetical protein DV096_00865 [Bradymonadaceae bacterium TMQ3]RVU48803.1 hypothetical protein EA187_05065 [Lujinxingia sediminis]TXC78096.1 hypothetical protein FRC91_05030 [Bradymonadales bacterium TMQ1]
MTATNLTSKQAYKAMYVFLDDIYQRTRSDTLGALLGSMSLLADGETADPAIWRDWENAVATVLDSPENVNIDLKFIKPPQ